VGDARK